MVSELLKSNVQPQGILVIEKQTQIKIEEKGPETHQEEASEEVKAPNKEETLGDEEKPDQQIEEKDEQESLKLGK